MAEPQKISSFTSTAVRLMCEDSDQLSQIFALWPTLVGDLCQHAKIVGLDKGRLLVGADSALVVSRLRFDSARIVRGFQRCMTPLCPINSISVQLV